MLVYCSSTLLLACPFDQVLGEVLTWLVAKTGLSEDRINAAAHKETALTINGQRVEFRQLLTDSVRLHAVRYTLPDERIQGRRWITEIGLRQHTESNHVECTVLLKTEEISVRVDAPIIPTRPLIVKRLLDNCSPTSATPGTDLRSIDEGNADLFLAFIDSKERKHPLILVSPQADRSYPVEPAKILYYLAGIADVVVIYPESDIASIRAVLGDDYCAWNGDIKVIYPRNHQDRYAAAPIFRLTVDDIRTIFTTTDVTPLHEILARLTHRVNWLNAWQHISFDNVKHEKRRHLLHLKRQELQASNDKASQQQLEDQTTWEAMIQELEQDVLTRDDDINRQKEQIQALKDELDQLKRANRQWLTSAHFTRAQITLNSTGEEFRDLIMDTLNQQHTSVKKSLELVESLFPDRVIVLKSAVSSASRSDVFKYPERALELLTKLATDYWEALCSGGSAKAAGERIFGKTDFAARESERVENNARAVALRTFRYKDQDVVMFRHLKHGVKHSPQETLRIHFHWDAEDKKIVIGHCGPHLDLD